MKKIFPSALILITLLVVWFSYLNNPKTILAKLGISKLKSPSTQLSYRVYLFGIIPVGTAILEDKGLVKKAGGKQRHLKAEAKGGWVADKIYHFRADIDSYIEPQTMLPVMFNQRLKTPDKEITKDVRYNQTEHIMEIAGESRHIEPETFDPLSALYKLRNLDLERLTDFDLNINTNQKNYAFTGSIKKQEYATGNNKESFYLLKGRIFRRDKNPYHQSQVDAMLFSEQERLPILIKVFASGVFITARLVDIR